MMAKNSLKIAIMGFRGIPACYGGFETFIEELAPLLVKKGHNVTVYGRSNIIDYKEKYYKGVRIVLLPTISHKYLDTVFHTFLCVLHSLFRRYDIVFILNAANSIFSILPRLTGKKVAVNVDGIERKRKKWGKIGKFWYSLGEIFSVKFPNVTVSDASVIQEYYRKKYNKDTIMIPYGAHTEKIATKDILKKLGIEENEYFLYVSRLEPENNAHIVIEAFENVSSKKKLIIVGGAPYADKYIDRLKKTEDPRIIFTGFVFGKGYQELQSNAFCYVHATEVGGTHPALIEAMGFGNCTLVNGTPENIEVLEGTGLIYKKNDVHDLTEKMQSLVDSPHLIEKFGEKAKKRIEENFCWDAVADQYHKLFVDLKKPKNVRARPS
jgi:glycosyltransferase involved in cell wall biosynthesis